MIEQRFAPPTEVKVPASHVVRDVIETLILTLLTFWLAQSVVQGFRVDGPSMEPTLHTGQRLFVYKLGYMLDEPQRGDIVVFWPPYESDERLIKRIIGLPGDHVEIEDDQLLINGEVLREPYLQDSPHYSGEWIVPDGSYFVLGDNRNSSYDSHNWSSYLPRDNIIGKAAVIYWPVAEWELVPHASALYGRP